jgi:hypothetical protein
VLVLRLRTHGHYLWPNEAELLLSCGPEDNAGPAFSLLVRCNWRALYGSKGWRAVTHKSKTTQHTHRRRQSSRRFLVKLFSKRQGTNEFRAEGVLLGFE